MELNEKIAGSKRAIRKLFAHYKRPVLMCSFGKDSMVLLHLVKMVCAGLPMIPILFHRDPWFPHKYEFADSVIRKWELTVFDYPPIQTNLWDGKGIVAFTNRYQVGIGEDNKPVVLAVPKNILPPVSGEKWLCGRNDLLGRPIGSFNYPWDLALVGHKSTDEDQIAGNVPLNCDTKINAHGPDYSFPLRHWTDNNVWAYTEAEGLPIQDTRYEKVDGHWREKADKVHNSDYWHACIACVDRRNKSPSVMCPLIGMEVSNISAQVPYQDDSQAYHAAS